MEFTVKKFDLLQELNLTQGVVERKTTIPILSHLLCEAKGNRVTLTATDLELSLRTSCEAKVKKEGAGTIPAKKLLELVRLLPEGEIRFRLLENHWVQITSERRNYKMVGMAKDNFPAIPAFPHPLVTIPAAILSVLIARTAFAISMEESRYTLNGAQLTLKPDSIAMVATDGHRLALAETDHSFAGLSNETKPLIPKKAMGEIQRLAGEAGENGQIEFARDDSHLFFRVESRLLISRILTGQFQLRSGSAARQRQQDCPGARRIQRCRAPRLATCRSAQSCSETLGQSGGRGTLRVESRIWRGDGESRERLQGRADLHRL